MKARDEKLFKILNLEAIAEICNKYSISTHYISLELLTAKAFNKNIDSGFISDYLNLIITIVTGRYLIKHKELQSVDIQLPIQNRKLGIKPSFLPIEDDTAKDIYLLCSIYHKYKQYVETYV